MNLRSTLTENEH